MSGMPCVYSQVTGYPVGREGPTARRTTIRMLEPSSTVLYMRCMVQVTMGSNLAYLITSGMALPFVRRGRCERCARHACTSSGFQHVYQLEPAPSCSDTSTSTKASGLTSMRLALLLPQRL